MRRVPFRPVLVLLTIPALAPSQTPEPSAMAFRRPDRVPVHTRVDVPTYGLWAAGRHYKASFHGGFAFYPRLGRAYDRNLPIVWRTSSIRAGDRELLGGPTAETSHSDWRCEHRTGDVVEAYDVRVDGVEQSFVFERRPASGGEISIRGEVETELFAASVADSIGALEFRSARGEVLVRYGKATAYDAAGRTCDVTTSWDGHAITLRVPAAFASGARYPLTVDPLLTPTRLFRTTYSISTSTATTHLGPARSTLVAQVDQFAGTDNDVYVFLYDDGYRNERQSHADISRTETSEHVATAFVGASRKFVAAYEFRPVNGGHGSLRTLTLDWQTLSKSVKDIQFANDDIRSIAIGGTHSYSTSDPRAMLVMDVVDHRTNDGEVFYFLLDTISMVASSARLVDWTSRTPFRRHGSINQVSSGGGAPWFVCWEEQANGFSPWEVRGTLVYPGGPGNTGGPAQPFRFGPQQTGHQEIWPMVAGGGATYLIVLGTTAPQLRPEHADRLWTVRLDWPVNTASPTIVQRRLIANNPGVGRYDPKGLAFDWRTQSHWAVTWVDLQPRPNVEIARLGGTGGVVEWHQIDAGNYFDVIDPAVCYDFRTLSFGLVYTVLDPVMARPTYATHLTYDPNAYTLPYGTSCGGSISASYPYAGQSNFTVSLTMAPANVNALLLIASRKADIPLSSFGMGACRLFVDWNHVIVPARTDGSGVAGFRVALPDFPPLSADAFAQWLHGCSTTPLQVCASNGIEIHVR